MLNTIIDSLIDGAWDTIKLLPFLFLTYLLMEFLEDRVQGKTKERIARAGKLGPVWGGLLGAIPQCGFSAAASNLFAGRVITMGTLIAIYLSTSDEMLPILISNTINPLTILGIVGIKMAIGIIAGAVVDLVLNRIHNHKETEVDIHHFCEHEHCSCGHGIVRPALVHTLKIAVFILVISVVLNIIIGVMGIETLSHSVFNIPVVGVLVAGLVGLIPNCGASVALATLYVEGAMPLGTMIAGLLVGAGVGILILFRVNEDRKENLIIVALLYAIGVISGVIINLLGI